MQLYHLHQAIIAAALRNGHGDITSELRDIAPFEYSIQQSHERYKHTTLWFRSDSREESEPLNLEMLAKPIEDAIFSISELARTAKTGGMSSIWRAAAACAKRLREEHPPTYNACLHALLTAIKSRSVAYPWSFDSFDSAVQELLPLLRAEEQWDFCKWTIERLNLGESADAWLSSASDNLRTLLLLHSTTTAGDRNMGLERELRTQEIWILGSAPDHNRKWPSIAINPRTEVQPSTWSDFALHGLLDLLDCNGAAQCRAAVKGIFALLAHDPPVNEHGCALWNRLNRKQRLLLLSLLERLAAEYPQHFSAWQSVVENELRSGTGAEQLQSWVTLQTYARTTGNRPEQWNLPTTRPNTNVRIIRMSKRLLEMPGLSKGTVRFSNKVSSLRSLARMFARAIGENENLIEAIIADHLNASSVQNNAVEKQPNSEFDGDMAITYDEDHTSTVDFLVREARAGRFGNISASAIAQALLSSDEPRIVTTSGIPMSNGIHWPVDDGLEALIVKGEGALQEGLRAVVVADISQNERVIGAEIETYSRDHDVVMHLASRWVAESATLVPEIQKTTFNGRAHLMYDNGGYEPRQSKEDGWFIFRAGGLGMFIHGALLITPAAIWRDFGWIPSTGNPLIWKKDGKVVVRCELIRGPIRNQAHDLLHRQPILLRWIVDEKEFKSAAEFLSAHATEHIEIEVEPADL